jgi:hypothetical protein
MWSNTNTDGSNNNKVTQKITLPFRKGRNEGVNKKAVQTKMTKYTNNGTNEGNQVAITLYVGDNCEAPMTLLSLSRYM